MRAWRRRVTQALPAGVKLHATQGHYHLVCGRCAATITTCSGSPKNHDNALRAVQRDIERYVGPHLTTCSQKDTP